MRAGAALRVPRRLDCLSWWAAAWLCSLLLVALTRYVALLAAGVASLAIFGALAGNVAHLAAIVARHTARRKRRPAGITHPCRTSAHSSTAASAAAAAAAPTSGTEPTSAGAVGAAEGSSAAAIGVPASVPTAALVALRALAGEVAWLVTRVALLGTHP